LEITSKADCPQHILHAVYYAVGHAVGLVSSLVQDDGSLYQGEWYSTVDQTPSTVVCHNPPKIQVQGEFFDMNKLKVGK